MNKSFARWVSLLLIATLLVAGHAYSCQAQSETGDESGLGRVFVDGSWITPEEFAQANEHNEILQEYVLLRGRIPDSFAGQARLARWCQTRSLDARREAHLKRALVHDPENRRVRSLLGHVQRNGEWYTSEQIKYQKKEFAAARQRYRDWREPIRQISRQLRSHSARLRELGAKRLGEITDPRSVTALEMILAPVHEPVALQALGAIDRFPQREATESISRIALLNPSEKVREHALDLLARRNRYDFLPDLVGELVSPVSTQVSITPDSNGNVLYQHVLFQKNFDKDVIRQFDSWMVQHPRNANIARQGNMAIEAGRRAMNAESDIRQLNDLIHTKNSRIQYALRRATDVNPGDSPEDWWRWWYDENEIYTAARPVSYKRVEAVEVTSSPQIPSSGECLVAGTPIWTDLGPKPVESLQVGDRVLCQNLDNRKLEYRTVLYPTTRPETPTFQIMLEDESIQASGGHLFWVKGEGWTKTRDLRVGWSLQTANGSSVEIKYIQSSASLPLYNLVVDHHANYFVGSSKILSHDSTIQARGEQSVEASANRGGVTPR